MRVAVGLSGGVDSAVVALLLRDQGYEVVGVHLYCWPPRGEYLVSSSKYLAEEEKEGLRKEWIRKNGCRADEDEQLALKTALELGIKFVKLDFSEEYNKRVVDYFYAEYEVGRTPNPDVLCNSEIKFGLFLDWALKNGFDYIATGHYAKLNYGSELAKNGPGTDCSSLATDNSSLPASDDYLHTRPENSAESGDQSFRDCVSSQEEQISSGPVVLCIPKDKHKDQTYFLWKLTEKELEHVFFPLGDFLKSEVREIALRNNLTVAKRKDSQGICFIGNVEAREFLSRRLKEKPGIVRDIKGNVIGEHSGVWFYTIGQRGGWRMDPDFQRKIVAKTKVKSIKSKVGMPVMYVISKDAKENELVVGVGKETESDSFSIAEANGNLNGKMLVRIRHTGQLVPCVVEDSRVELAEPQKGVAPGQSAVFYREQRTPLRHGLRRGAAENSGQREIVMLGGGVIA